MRRQELGTSSTAQSRQRSTARRPASTRFTSPPCQTASRACTRATTKWNSGRTGAGGLGSEARQPVASKGGRAMRRVMAVVAVAGLAILLYTPLAWAGAGQLGDPVTGRISGPAINATIVINPTFGSDNLG